MSTLKNATYWKADMNAATSPEREGGVWKQMQRNDNMEDIWTAGNSAEDIVAAIDRLADAVRNQTMALQIINRKKDKHSPEE